MYDGELGVLPSRAPLIGRLAPGELRLRHGQETKRFYIDGGFAQVRKNVVTVLTPKAITAQDIDSQAAAQALQPAHAATHTPEAQQARDKAQAQARAQLRIAKRGRG
jgi:F-type H+-transporting ATPase subunit epsilon